MRKYANGLKNKAVLLLALLFLLCGCSSSSLSEATSNIYKTNAPNVSSAISDDSAPVFNSSSPELNAERSLTVNFLDVGQGDSIFIELPNNETILIDAGNAENGADIVNYIKAEGYDTINYLVGTHPHADHIGGMAYVVDNLNISAIYMPKVSNNTSTFEDLLLTIKDKGLSINTAKAGVDLINLDKLRVSIVAPNSGSYEDLNDYSAVIKITFGNNTFLFMGDAGTTSESEITGDIKADVLKIGHHGSASSTGITFLNKVLPKYAVISVGLNNDYGHPTQTTLDKLSEAGAVIYRTDKNGTIVFASDGTNISVSTEKDSDINEADNSNTSSTNNETTVFITESGSKYHSDGCGYLGRSKIAISLEDAISEGYEPCSKCNPPMLSGSTSVSVSTSNPDPTPTIAETQPQTIETTVYVTNTGSKYHSAGCQYLSKSQIAISLSDAKAQGYGPCSKCNPPS